MITSHEQTLRHVGRQQHLHTCFASHSKPCYESMFELLGRFLQSALEIWGSPCSNESTNGGILHAIL